MIGLLPMPNATCNDHIKSFGALPVCGVVSWHRALHGMDANSPDAERCLRVFLFRVVNAVHNQLWMASKDLEYLRCSVSALNNTVGEVWSVESANKNIRVFEMKLFGNIFPDMGCRGGRRRGNSLEGNDLVELKVDGTRDGSHAPID